MLLMFIILQLSDGIVISQNALDNAGLAGPGYGFTMDENIYLSYTTNIVKFDMQGNETASFTKRGQGPGEMRLGGPIFPFKNEIWVYDVKNKLLALDQNLDYQREIKLRFSGYQYINPFSDLKNMYSLSATPTPDGFVFTIESRNERDFSKKSVKDLAIQPDFTSGITPAFLFDDFIAFFEMYHKKERYSVYVWDRQSGQVKAYRFLAPDFNLEPGDLHHASTHFDTIDKAPYISSVAFSENRLLVFLEKYLGRRGALMDMKYYLVELDFESGQPVEIGEAGYRRVPSPGHSDHLVFHHPEIGIELAPR